MLDARDQDVYGSVDVMINSTPELEGFTKFRLLTSLDIKAPEPAVLEKTQITGSVISTDELGVTNGTIDGLIDRLCAVPFDQLFRFQFFFTYRQFLKPSELLEALIEEIAKNYPEVK